MSRVRVGDVFVSNDPRDPNRAPYVVQRINAAETHAYLTRCLMTDRFPNRVRGRLETTVALTALGTRSSRGWTRVA